MNPETITRVFKRIAKNLGLSSRKIHSARHSVATTLISEGVDYRTVASIMRHTDAMTTVRLYSHVKQEKHTEAVTSYSDRFFKVKSG
jgi:site-specific recombinase XerD